METYKIKEDRYSKNERQQIAISSGLRMCHKSIGINNI